MILKDLTRVAWYLPFELTHLAGSSVAAPATPAVETARPPAMATAAASAGRRRLIDIPVLLPCWRRAPVTRLCWVRCRIFRILFFCICHECVTVFIVAVLFVRVNRRLLPSVVAGEFDRANRADHSSPENRSHADCRVMPSA